MGLYSLYGDEQLLALLKENDEGAITEIFDRYNKLLYNHVFNKLRQEAEARDIVQEVFIKLWERRAQVESVNLAGYLFTMVRNRVLNVMSHHRIIDDYAQFQLRYGSRYSVAADDLVLEKELEAMIEGEIAALPTRMREIFELSRKERLSNKEIAQKLGLSEHTVADQIKKSLRVLRPKIGLLLVLGYLLGR